MPKCNLCGEVARYQDKNNIYWCGKRGCRNKLVKSITPHKGGRTERLYVRLTPEHKIKLEIIANKKGVSHADVISDWIDQYDLDA